MSIKPCDVWPLPVAWATEQLGSGTMDLRPLSDTTTEERQLELCATCGHLRSQHKDEVGQVCWSNVAAEGICGHGCEPCPCKGYVADPSR
jgi:hypothetical protein